MPIRVLLIEDDPDVRELSCELLGRAGYQVLSASNPVDGLALACNESNIAAIVTDMHFGLGKTCAGMAAKLRQRGLDTPIVMSSADPLAAATAAEIGARFLRKPYGVTALLAALDAVLPDHAGLIAG